MTNVVFCNNNNKKNPDVSTKRKGVNSECNHYKTSSHSIKVVLKDIADLEFFLIKPMGNLYTVLLK